jgi:hypothetical protein
MYLLVTLRVCNKVCIHSALCVYIRLRLQYTVFGIRYTTVYIEVNFYSRYMVPTSFIVLAVSIRVPKNPNMHVSRYTLQPVYPDVNCSVANYCFNHRYSRIPYTLYVTTALCPKIIRTFTQFQYLDFTILLPTKYVHISLGIFDECCLRENEQCLYSVN